MNFLGKERRGYLGGHPNVSDIHQTSLQRKRLKLENGKGSDCRRVAGERGHRTGEKGSRQTNSFNAEPVIANGREGRQVASACLHVVNCSQLIHHACCNTSLLQPLLSVTALSSADERKRQT